MDPGRVVPIIGRKRAQALSLFVVALAFRLLYWAYQGTRIRGDAHGYLHQCDAILADPISWLQFSGYGLYAGFNVPMCTTQWAGLPPAGWVFLQMIFSALVVVMVFDIARSRINARAGLAAGLAMALLWDSFHLTITLLSDSFFVFALTLSLWSIDRYRRQSTAPRKLVLLAALALVAVSRPFGIPIVFAWIAGETVLQVLGDDRDARLFFHPLANLFVLGLLVGLFSFLSLSGARMEILGYWHEGLIITNTLFYSYSPTPADSFLGFFLANPTHVPFIAVLRMATFFIPGISKWSLFHNAVNYTTLFPILVAGAIGLRRAITHHRRLLFDWLVPLLVILGIVGFTFMNMSYRYRAPAGPIFALFAGYAVGTDPRIGALVSRLGRRFRQLPIPSSLDDGATGNPEADR